MAFRVIFIFKQIGADGMGYKIPYWQDYRTCPHRATVTVNAIISAIGQQGNV